MQDNDTNVKDGGVEEEVGEVGKEGEEPAEDVEEEERVGEGWGEGRWVCGCGLGGGFGVEEGCWHGEFSLRNVGGLRKGSI